jgi:hypothetical protein
VATKINPPIIGYWNLRDFPDVVWFAGASFRKAVIKQGYDGVVEQYREDVEKNSRHLKVRADGTWCIDHVDEDNPDRGRPIQHFFNDHPLGPLAALALLVGGGVLVVRAMASA